MGFIKPNNNSGGSGGGLTPQELSRLNNAYTHSKSEHAPTTAEQNVQPDWNETDTTSDAYIKNKPDLSQIGSGGNIPSVTQIEPQELDMPKVFFYGNALPTTKDNVLLTMDYISNTDKFSSFVKLKCQGTSSMSYAKKNFTVAMYSDEARETKLKKDFKGWGAQSKFCLKANYVDTTHTRNISGARIAYDMVASRPDSAFKQQLLQCPRNGLVDGFPIKLYFNGEFYGIYTWNIPKDAWMFNMDKSNLNHIVLCAERNTDGNANAINSCQFRQLWTNGDGQDWSVEVGTMSEDLRTKFNRVIAFVMNATDQEFHDNIGEYFDLYSLLDYYCFSYFVNHLDGLAKNMLMVTYDGVIWGASLYDMDSIYGVSWNGGSFVSPQYQCPEQYQEQFSRLWVRIEQCFATELYARYLELRQGALSLSNIVKHVEEIYDVIPDRVFADEKAKWTSLPNVSTNTMTRFRNYMRDRAVYVDAQMQEIGTKVPCTGIVLSADTLSFTTTDTQTLSVVVSPDNTTDTVTWSVSPSGVVTVNNGVVTPIRNGEATVTATCGTQTANCAVTVSGMSESGGGNTGNYVTDSLYAYYDLTRLSTEATTVEDLSGNNNTFNVVSGTLSKDNLGGLIYSKDSNALIKSDSFNPQTAEASIEYTFKYTGMDNCNSTSNFPNRTCGINGDNGQGYYSWAGGFGYCIFKSNTKITTDTPFPNTLVNGEYYHIVCTFGDSEAKYYLNGELLGTYSHATTGIPNNTTYYIGATSTNSGAPAQTLYSSRFYNKVLSQDEVTQNYTYEFTKLGLISGGDTGVNPNLVFQVNSASMNIADNTLTDSVARISATLVGNPTVSDNQIAFDVGDTFSFDISSLNLTNSNRTFRIKFTPTTLDDKTRNAMAFGKLPDSWGQLTSCYLTSEKFVLQHASTNFANFTIGSGNSSDNSNRLTSPPITGREYELVISENADGNVRWFIDGTLVQNGTTTLFNPLYITNIEGANRFIGSYSLIEIYNGYCNDYTEFTNMVNNTSSGVNYLTNASWQVGTLDIMNNPTVSGSVFDNPDDRYTSVQIPTGKYALRSSNATWKKFRLSDSKGNVMYYNSGDNNTNDLIIDTTIYDDVIFTLEISYYKPNDTIEVPSLITTTESNITTLTLDGSLNYAIPNWPHNPSGENGQVNAEYLFSDIHARPSCHLLKGYTHNNNIADASAKGLAKQYRVSLWNNKLYLSFTLDMAETGVTNDVESVTNYLSNNPLTFKYVM